MDEQNIPIDINTTKLLDWLVSRRHIPKDWQEKVLKIREKINNAIQDMPEHEEIVKLVSGQHINYFHCVKIVEILKETEKDSKNIFGRYGSQRMKDWQDILASYQNDNVYLAEVASMLIRNVSYEIPSLKKQIQKLEQLQAESERKIKECNKSETLAQKEFKAACDQLGIKGENIKKELLDLLKNLPEVHEKTAEKIKIVQGAIELYAAFNKFLSGQDNIEFDVLPTLSFLINHGNTTTYQYVYGEIPLRVEEPQIFTGDDEKVVDFGGESNNEIDFGGDENNEIDFGGESNNEIDFGGDGNNEIDFGDEVILANPVTDGSSRGSSDESFEIVNYEELNLEESGIVVEGSGEEGGIARNGDALTLLDNPKYREQIINELTELESFLKMRIFEMSHESDLLSLSHIPDAPTILQMQTLETVTSLTDCVNVALSHVTDKRTQHLHNLKHSPNYVDVLTGSLRQKLGVVERMRATKSVLERRIRENGEEIRKLEPLIRLFIERTKQLQKQIENDVAGKYKGRIVNIVGGVNTL